MDNQERQCWNDAVKDCMTAVEKLKKPNGNSKHGYCCTCTTCKNYHDECVCDYNTMIQEVLDTLKKELK